jgi:hypothetical protein
MAFALNMIASAWMRRAFAQSAVAMTAIGGGAGEVTNFIDVSDAPPLPVVVDMRDKLPTSGLYPMRTRKPETLVIHHTASTGQGWGTIAQFHVEVNKWQAIGYAFGTSWDGKCFVLQDPERRQNQTRGHNSTTIGLAMLGNFDKAPIGHQQEQATRRFVRHLLDRYGYKRVRAHRHLVSTACPGRYAVEQLADLWTE